MAIRELKMADGSRQLINGPSKYDYSYDPQDYYYRQFGSPGYRDQHMRQASLETIMRSFTSFLESQRVPASESGRFVDQFYDILMNGGYDRSRSKAPRYDDKPPKKAQPLVARIQFYHDMEEGFYIVYPPNGADALEYNHWKSIEALFVKEGWVAEWIGDEQYKPKQQSLNWIEDQDEDE